MLAGLQDSMVPAGGQLMTPDLRVGPSMFDTLGRGVPSLFAPDPDEMAAQMDRLRVRRSAMLRAVRVCTYDLSDPAEREQYQLDVEHLLIGQRIRTHVLLAKPELQFVAGGETRPPRYIAHLQWIEFELQETPSATAGVVQGEQG